MKSGRSGTPLQLGLNVATLGVVGLVAWYLHGSREVNAYQALQQMHTRNSLAMGQLLEDSAAYARTDPSIIPLLQQLSGRGRPSGATSAPAPANLKPSR